MKEYITKKYPFLSVPRQIGLPERINCISQEQLFYRLNKYNGIKRKLYISINRTNEFSNFDNVIVDWIPYDMDSDKSLDNARRVFKYCEEHDLKSMYMFSTGGFWTFIRTTNVALQYPKVALAEAQRSIAKDIGLTIGHSKDADLDQAIIGDVARITRAINSKDIGRKRFCIILSKTDLFKSYEEICEIAKKPRFEYYCYGDKLFDLTKFDKRIAGNSTDFVVPNLNIDMEQFKDMKYDIDIDNFLPCVKSWLTIKECGVFKARYFFAVYCSQTGIPAQKCNELAKKYFSVMPRTDRLRNNYNHFLRDRTLVKGYHLDKVFPNCDSLIIMNLCPFNGKCDKYRENNSPIYY